MSSGAPLILTAESIICVKYPDIRLNNKYENGYDFLFRSFIFHINESKEKNKINRRKNEPKSGHLVFERFLFSTGFLFVVSK